MTFVSRARAAYRALERFAEAVEADPLDGLYRRVARLEQQAGTALPSVTAGPDAEGLARQAGPIGDPVPPGRSSQRT